MSDIPKDIRKTAMAVWRSMPETGNDDDFSSVIAEALMAERERCAKIVAEWPENDSYLDKIVAAIRSQPDTSKGTA